MLRLAVLLSCLSAPLWAEMRLVMVDQDGCVWCERWEEEIAPIYAKTQVGQVAPLERMDIGRANGTDGFAQRVNFTPTFILTEDGREVGRIEGYPGEDFFWPVLEQLVEAQAKEDLG